MNITERLLFHRVIKKPGCEIKITYLISQYLVMGIEIELLVGELTMTYTLYANYDNPVIFNDFNLVGHKLYISKYRDVIQPLVLVQ